MKASTRILYLGSAFLAIVCVSVIFTNLLGAIGYTSWPFIAAQFVMSFALGLLFGSFYVRADKRATDEENSHTYNETKEDS